jgi:hypothetical protein
MMELQSADARAAMNMADADAARGQTPRFNRQMAELQTTDTKAERIQMAHFKSQTTEL